MAPGGRPAPTRRQSGGVPQEKGRRLFVKLDTFVSQLELQCNPDGQAGIDRFAREMRARLENMQLGFSREAMDVEISRLGLYTADDGDGFELPFA